MSNVSMFPVSVPDAFPTIFDLRAQHGALISRQRQGTSVPELADDVRLFVDRAQVTGAILDAAEQRDAAQGLIDYWVTTLYRAAIELDDATLADFDADLAPALDDALCPYVGLSAFEEQTSGRFFGRERLIAAAVDRLANERVLAVLGPSGSGKSSILLGGVLPKLKALHPDWRFFDPLVPGSDPLATLQAALGASTDATPAVLVVDQLEEVFTLCDDHAVRDAFMARLIAFVDAPEPRQTLLVTLRTDYEPYLAKYPRAQELFAAGELRATPLSAVELREAVEKPAESIGLKLETGLVAKLVDDVLGEPAALPLLQFTLLRLWQERDHNRITLAGYARVGRSREALARAADKLYGNLLPEDQVIMRKILLRMVRPAAGEETTRRRVGIAELQQIGHAPKNVERVLDKLLEARLVRRSGETVEVAHEALIRNWPQFVTWLEEKRAQLMRVRRLESLAEEWQRFDRHSGFLDDEQLVEAEKWIDGDEARDVGIKDSLRALVVASRALAEKRKAHARRGKRFLVAMMIVLLAVLGLLGVAYEDRKEKILAAADADARAKAADARTKVMEQRRQARAASQALILALRADPHVRRTANIPASKDNETAAGRLCCVVVDGKGERYLLTLGFATVSKRSSSPEKQRAKPGGNTSDESSIAGALITVSDDDLLLRLPQLGAFARHTGPIAVGEAVRLAGSSVKRGKVTNAKFHGDGALTTLDAKPGDSGELVVNDRNELVGILGTSGKEGAIVLSIDPILRELQVTLAPPP
jgi:hypothetical protein